MTDGLSEPDARWRLVGNSVMISPLGLDFVPNDVAGALARLLGVPQDGLVANADAWDGYTADRRRLLDHLGGEHIDNTVFLTGDIHSSWACDVDAALYPLSRSLTTEIVATSVTSDNVDDILGVPPRSVSPPAATVIRTLNRHIAHTELDSHGYVVVDVTAERTQADWFHLQDRTVRGGGARRAVSYATPSGTQRLRRIA